MNDTLGTITTGTSGDFGTIIAAGIGLIVAPLSEFLHNKLPGDYAVLQPAYSLILSIGIGILFKLWLFPDMTNAQVVIAVLGSQLISQFFTAAKAGKQITNGGSNG